MPKPPRNSSTRPSILYVIPAVGGPAHEFALPRLHRHGDVHAMVFAPPSPAVEAIMRRWCASVRPTHPDAPMPETIVSAAREVGADAVVAFSETAIVAVAAACEELGLRGPGPNVVRSRDKALMRSVWRDASLPGPAFVAVRSRADLERAAAELRKPFLLKPTWLAGSLAQIVVEEGTDIAGAWEQAVAAVLHVDDAGVRDLMAMGRGPRFVAEEIIEATTDSWYDDHGYGDYVSVEGLVVRGRYHPVCITARMPTIPPFVEVGFHSPTVMPADRQRRIEELARRAVDALCLDTCCTHTEIKLQRDQSLCLLESAARLGGALIPQLTYTAFGVDLIDLLVRALLGEIGNDVGLPDRMLTSGRLGPSGPLDPVARVDPVDSVGRADPDGLHGSAGVAGTGGVTAASLMLMAVDSSGKPWATLPTYRPDYVDWESLTTPGTSVEIVGGRPSGSPMPAFSPTGGTLNFAGSLLLQAPDPRVLRDDCHRILDGLEGALHAADTALSVEGDTALSVEGDTALSVEGDKQGR